MAVDLIRLPKAELHVHIEGTLEPELALSLARRNHIKLRFDDLDALRGAYRFADLSGFLSLYYEMMATLVTEDDFYQLAISYFRKAASHGVRHSEIFVDPQAHLSRGVSWDTLMAGLSSARAEAAAELNLTSAVIVCLVRDRPVAEAWEVFEAVLADRDRVLGIGLDSAEVGYPPELFAEIFRRARQAGLRTTAHAGEEGPASYIASAVDVLGVQRVDHGLHLADDPQLLRRVSDLGIALTMCPLSNLALHTVSSMAEHPALWLLDSGVTVTINSDDPAYFGGYIGDNFAALQEIGMTDSRAVQLARNSIEASFAEPARKIELQRLIDDALAVPGEVEA